MSAQRLGVALAVPSLVAIGLLAGSLLASSGSSDVAIRRSAGASTAASTRLSPALDGREEGVVANAEQRQLLVYAVPGGSRPRRRYSNPTPEGTPLVFLVRGRRGGWLRVMLPSRPNGSEGWIRADAVELRSDAYSVLVDLRRKRLVVRDAKRLVLAAAVGVGRAVTPTPSGLYYVTELLRQPDPGGLYGPWAFALSAHSSVLSHFGGGDGQVGIHGTDDPSGVGQNVSHGCIRVRNRVIERLASILPLGTPVRIVARAHTSSRQRNTRVSRS